MRVLVIDRDQERGKAICEPLLECSAETYYYDGQARSKAPNYLINISFPAGLWDLVLLHNNDDGLRTSLNLSARFLFRYTGGTPQLDVDWIKARAIAGVDDALSVGEAQEILDWVGDPEKAKRPLPSLLRVPKAEFLPAIAILCQGFLAVYAKEHRTDEIGTEVQAALDAMGWDGGKHAHLVRESLGTVATAQWWLDALGFGRATESGGFEVDPTLLQRAREAIIIEWSPAQPAPEFEVLWNDLEAQKDALSATTVAEAYHIIAARLEGVSRR